MKRLILFFAIFAFAGQAWAEPYNSPGRDMSLSLTLSDINAETVTVTDNIQAATYGSGASPIPDATLLGIDDGTTDQIFVGGGANLPGVWTTSTGTGAPVRADRPTLIAPVLGAATGTSLTLSGLTASLPVFSGASKALETKTIAQAQAALGFYAGTGTFNSTTGVSISIGATLAGTTYRVAITPTADPLNVGGVYATAKAADGFTVKCTGSDTSCTFDWILIDMN